MNEPKIPSPETAKERRWQWYVGIGAVVLLVSALGNVFLNFQIRADQQTIGNKDQQIVTLLHERTATKAQQAKQTQQGVVFLKDLDIFGEFVFKTDAALCAVTHATCPPIPTFQPIPK